MSQPFLYVWDVNQLGLPHGIEDISQFLEKVENASPSSNLKAFIAKIQLMALHDTRLKLEAVSPYLSLVQNTANHHYPVVALEQANVPEAQFLAVLAKIVTIAQSLNIAIYDDNRVMLFLPTGDILPNQRAAWWIGALDYLEDTDSIKDISEVSQEVERLAADMWQRHPDYEKHELQINEHNEWICRYKKETSIGIQYIYIYIFTDQREFVVSAGINIDSPMIANICNEAGYHRANKTSRILIISIVDHYKTALSEELAKLTGQPVFNSIKRKSQIAQQITYIEQASFKLLEYMEDIQNLDQLLNDTTIVTSIMTRRHNVIATTWLALIVAHLANNPNFDTIAEKLAAPEELAKLSVEKQQQYQQQYHKLLNYLREHVKPLI